MEYKDALKKVQAVKPKDNYMVIKLGYDNKIVLPYKDAVAFIATLNNAEHFDEQYNKPHRINELDRSKIEATLMSHQEYERYKIAVLLNITADEVKEAQLQAQQQETV
jgi:hypothetical protein